MTDAAYSRSLAQTNSLRIRQGSLLTDNGMVAPGCRHANLIPSLPFARGIAASVQYRGNLVVAVANGHTTDDIQRLHRRGGFRCRTWPLHRKLRMHTSLPVSPLTPNSCHFAHRKIPSSHHRNDNSALDPAGDGGGCPASLRQVIPIRPFNPLDHPDIA